MSISVESGYAALTRPTETRSSVGAGLPANDIYAGCSRASPLLREGANGNFGSALVSNVWSSCRRGLMSAVTQDRML